MKKVSVLGAGSWGTALSILLNHNGHDVTIWSIDEREVQMLSQEREQKDKLPGAILADSIKITGSIEEAITGKDILVLAVPSPYVRSTSKMMAPFVESEQIIVNVAKGIEEDTLMTMSQIIEQEIKDTKIAVLSGPSHAEEVCKGIPTTVVVGSKNKEVAMLVQDVFMSEVFRVYTSPDVTGIELGGSLKNVIALAAGMVDGLGFGDNTKAALITRGITELQRLGNAMGAKPETISGLSGIGDLIVTCTSKHSRNRNAGYLMGQGKTYQEAMDEVKMIVEGVYSAKAASALAKKYDVNMPIIDAVNQVLFEGVNAREAALALLMRGKTKEVVNMEWE